MPLAFVLSVAVALQGWRGVQSRAFGRDAHVATGGALIGLGLGCLGLPLLYLGWSPLWLFFLLPFTACLGAVVRGLVVSVGLPYRRLEWGSRWVRGWCAAGAALALGTVLLTLGVEDIPRDDSRGYRWAFALGCLLLCVGIAHIPTAVTTPGRCTHVMRFGMLAAPYFGLPLLAVVVHMVWSGKNPFAQATMDLAFDPLVRGCLVGMIVSTALAAGLWLRRLALEDRAADE